MLASDEARLSSTLFSPEGIEDGPAVVVVQQGGIETRDNPLFLQIQETFNAIGYSVFVDDRRGHGESGGDPGQRDSHAFVVSVATPLTTPAEQRPAGTNPWRCSPAVTLSSLSC